MTSLYRLLLICLFFAPASSNAAHTVTPAPPKAAEVFIPVGKGASISLYQLAHIKPSEYAALSGQKMKLGERISFWLLQKKLRRSINADGTINAEKLESVKRIDPAAKFHLGGFVLGLLLGIFGVLIAYFINDDKKLARTRWAWIGFAAWIVLILLVII